MPVHLEEHSHTDSLALSELVLPVSHCTRVGTDDWSDFKNEINRKQTALPVLVICKMYDTIFLVFMGRHVTKKSTFFDSRNGYSSVTLVKLPIFGFLVIILAK